MIMDYYGSGCKNVERKMIITPVKDDYGRISTVVFSIEGSPPKGIALFLHREEGFGAYDSKTKTLWGKITLFGNGERKSIPYDIKIDCTGYEEVFNHEKQ